jgi:glyoxylase I family protein
VLFAAIHHVSINVSDVDRALTFYRDLLGMVRLPRPNFEFDGAWLEAGTGGQVHLIVSPVPKDMGQHFALRVDDVDHVVTTLRAAGIETPDPIPVGDTGMRQTFVSDPDGNRVEFNQPA